MRTISANLIHICTVSIERLCKNLTYVHKVYVIMHVIVQVYVIIPLNIASVRDTQCPLQIRKTFESLDAGAENLPEQSLTTVSKKGGHIRIALARTCR